MSNLSPQAQEVFWAFNRVASGKPDVWQYLPAIAAALRAAVGHDLYKADLRDQMEVMFSEGWNSLRKELLTVADELEAE
jgi:hypothetical protein